MTYLSSVTDGWNFYPPSERIGKAGGRDKRETAFINSSLSSLHRVLAALADPTATHIPYWDSKLTHLLQVYHCT